jgi:hypothetical protein
MNRKRRLSRADLDCHLQEQLGFLERSADAFDRGYQDEAKPLAVTIRVLVHESGSSQSLLSQLGRKDAKFFNSALDVDGTSLTSQSDLADVAIGPGGVRHVARLDTGDPTWSRWTDFETWWNQVIFRDLEGQELTRRDLVLVVAIQDGGAHVDASLDETYARISRQNSLGRYAASEKKLAPLGSAELVSIRQVAHELLKSLKPGYRRDRRPDGSAIIDSVTFHVQQTRSGAASGAGDKSDSGRDKDTADPRGPRKP